jgi:hypothetical protein
MPTLQTDFIITASFKLPGLGVLVLPASPPAWLADYALHTALSVTLLIEGQPPSLLIGTIEELARDDQPPRRALLLDFAPDDALPPGTHLLVGKTPTPF